MLISTSERCSKVLPFDNKSKKIVFCFVLCSLIRTFAIDHWYRNLSGGPVRLLWVKQ